MLRVENLSFVGGAPLAFGAGLLVLPKDMAALGKAHWTLAVGIGALVILWEKYAPSSRS